MGEYKSLAGRIDVSKLRWIERLCLAHAEPANLFLHLIAGILLVYGLWINVIEYVIIAIIIALLGHTYIWSINRKSKEKKKK